MGEGRRAFKAVITVARSACDRSMRSGRLTCACSTCLTLLALRGPAGVQAVTQPWCRWQSGPASGAACRPPALTCSPPQPTKLPPTRQRPGSLLRKWRMCRSGCAMHTLVPPPPLPIWMTTPCHPAHHCPPRLHYRPHRRPHPSLLRRCGALLLLPLLSGPLHPASPHHPPSSRPGAPLHHASPHRPPSRREHSHRHCGDRRHHSGEDPAGS